MKTLIDNYANHPGEHCGSVAMRGLLQHYCGLELPEPVVFGLGAGVDCVVVEGPMMNPTVAFGRTITMEADVGRSLQLDYRENPEADDDRAWEVVREEVLAGRPTMLSGDIFYLDYREYKVHFPGHRFVLLGFDDEKEVAYIADRLRPEPEACSYGALRRSRNPSEGMSTHNLWGRFHGAEPGRSLDDAARFALGEAARRMLGEGKPQPFASGAEGDAGDFRMTGGIAGIERLAELIPVWGGASDAAWIAGYNAQCIEKFGNGGGNFRRMYAQFLDWTRERLPSVVPADAAERAVEAADGWTALAADLEACAANPADESGWAGAAERAGSIAQVERRLFTDILAAVG